MSLVRLPVAAQAQIDALKRGWMYVGEAIQLGNRHCDECRHYAERNDMERYGEGVVYRTYTECTLGSRASDMPTDCPAYRSHLEAEAEEA